MEKPCVLIVGTLMELAEQLQSKCTVIVEPDLGQASLLLSREWIHLCIIHMSPYGERAESVRAQSSLRPIPANASDITLSDALVQFALSGTGHPPKILVLPDVLDRTGQLVHDALNALKSPAPVLAVAAPEQDTPQILDTVDHALLTCLRRNLNLVIKPDYILRDLANHLAPDADPQPVQSELESLVRSLFYDCNSIQITMLNEPESNRGRIRTIWVSPASAGIPQEHPLLVKIGRKPIVDELRVRYDAFLFRLTHVRAAGYAQTRSFAALAYPAPSEEKDIYDKDFCRFYQESARREADDLIRVAIDHFFEAAAKPWNKQKGPPPELPGLQSYYADRFNLKDPKQIENILRGIVETALRHRVRISLHNDEIAFKLSESFDSYPNPFRNLYKKRSDLKIFNRPPDSVCIGHCNLTGINLSVDERGGVWVDGYEGLAWGPTVADVVALEALLKFHCLDEENVLELYRFEKFILTPNDFNPPATQPEFRSIKIGGLLKWIWYLRNRWGERHCGGMEEYYANLFFFTIRELFSPELAEYQRIHALFSAAMLGLRLSKFPSIDWPGHLVVR